MLVLNIVYIIDIEPICPLQAWMFLGYRRLLRLRLGNELGELVDKRPAFAIVPIR